MSLNNGRFMDSSIAGSKDLQKRNVRQADRVFKEVASQIAYKGLLSPGRDRAMLD